MTPLGNMGGRSSNGSQGEGKFKANNGYRSHANVATELDSIGLSVPGTPSGFVKREQTTPTGQSKFAGYGMQNGPFDRVSQHGQLNTPIATANNYQYSSANVHRGAYADSGFKSPNNTAGRPNHNGYGFPMSNERHPSRPATVRGDEHGYLNPPSGQLQKSGFINNASTPSNSIGSYHIDEGAINASILGMQRGQVSNGGTSTGYVHHQSRGTPQTPAQSVASGGVAYETSHGFQFGNQSGDNEAYDEDADLNFDMNDDGLWSYFDDHQPAGGYNRGS